MNSKKIAIVGIGNIGGAIAHGLIKSNAIALTNINVADKMEALLGEMKALGVNAFQSNIEATKEADIVIVAVKPYHIEGVLNELKPILNKDKVLISIVAGVELDVLAGIVEHPMPIFRVMPNTAIAIQESMTCISINDEGQAHKEFVFKLFDNLGETVEIDEGLMASATALSSCGVAYALRYIRASMQAGIEMGFSADKAQFITAQTVKGATELILQGGGHPEREIDKVTTPQGLTIKGLNEMEHKGFSSSLIKGILASCKK